MTSGVFILNETVSAISFWFLRSVVFGKYYCCHKSVPMNFKGLQFCEKQLASGNELKWDYSWDNIMPYICVCHHTFATGWEVRMRASFYVLPALKNSFGHVLFALKKTLNLENIMTLNVETGGTVHYFSFSGLNVFFATIYWFLYLFSVRSCCNCNRYIIWRTFLVSNAYGIKRKLTHARTHILILSFGMALTLRGGD